MCTGMEDLSPEINEFVLSFFLMQENMMTLKLLIVNPLIN